MPQGNSRKWRRTPVTGFGSEALAPYQSLNAYRSCYNLSMLKALTFILFDAGRWSIVAIFQAALLYIIIHQVAKEIEKRYLSWKRHSKWLKELNPLIKQPFRHVFNKHPYTLKDCQIGLCKIL